MPHGIGSGHGWEGAARGEGSVWLELLWESQELQTHRSRRRPGDSDFCSWTLLSQKHKSGRETAFYLGRLFFPLPSTF